MQICLSKLLESSIYKWGEEKYSICAIISKKDTETLEKISNAFEEVKKDNIVNWGGRIPKNLKTPLKDGDMERPNDEAFKILST